MSTKIYYAYRTRKKNLERLISLLQKERITMQMDSMNKVAEIIAEQGIDYESDEFRAKHIKKKTTIMWDFCKNSEVSIWLHKDKWVYIKLFGDYEHINHLVSVFESNPWIEDYHYQNQTDPPDGISWRKFKKREVKWDEITGGETYKSMLKIVMVGDFILDGWDYEFIRMVDFYKEKLELKKKK